MVLSGETQWVSSSGKPREMAELSCTISSAGTCCLGWGKLLLMLLSLNSVPYLAETLSQTLIQMVIHETDKTRDFFTSWAIREAHERGKTHQRQNHRDADSQIRERLQGMEINQIRAIAAEGCACKEARMWQEMSEGIDDGEEVNYAQERQSSTWSYSSLHYSEVLGNVTLPAGKVVSLLPSTTLIGRKAIHTSPVF